MDKILHLNELDAEGNMTGDTRVVTLSIDAIMDIVDTSRSLAIQFRNGNMSQIDLEHQLANLHEALDTYGLVTPAETPRP
jgi:hypothetical protein